MSLLKATKITKQNEQSKQLVTFITSLGVPCELELYSCGDNVYINSEVVLPVLTVDIQWFIKNSETPLHYIKINKKIYINRYGMTKLLGQSKQPAAFKLQDYLYELFYKVETQGHVNKDEIVSRKKLLMLTNQVDSFRSVIENNQVELEEARNQAKIAQLDCDAYSLENAQLTKELEELEAEHKEQKEELETYKSIANKLSKYVRIRSKNPPDEAYDDNLDQDDDEIDDEVSELKMVRDAIQAKNKYKEITTTTKTKPKPAVKPTVEPDKSNVKTYYLHRSAYPVTQDEFYHWSLTDVAPSDELIEQSKEFLLEDPVSFPHRNIVYRDIRLSVEKKNAIVLFFEITNGVIEESTISRLLNI